MPERKAPLGQCFKWEFKKDRLKERVKQCSSNPNRVLEKKKKRATFQPQGTGPAAASHSKKGQNETKKNILCEWRAGRNPDRADDHGADIK